MINKILPALAIASLLASCKKDESAPNKFSDPVLVKIYDFKDRRLSDSLYQFFSDPNAVYRKEAAFAFGSIQDSAAMDKLGKLLLMDADTSVREAAAFAIGQTPNRESERIILGALAKEKHGGTLQALLTAYGKTTIHWQLAQPALLNDTSKASGFAWSMYYAGLRGKTDTSANQPAALLLQSKYNARTRLGAAHFFARASKNFDYYAPQIMLSSKQDPLAEVRMAATWALRKIKTDATFQALTEILKTETDYRVKVNAVKALESFTLSEAKELLYDALSDKHLQVGIAASETIKALATHDQWIELSNRADNLQHWKIKANIYEAALKASDNKSVVNEIINAFNQATNPYYKAALITALQQSKTSLDFLEEQLLKSEVFVIRSSAAAALVAINRGHTGDTKLEMLTK